MKINSLPHRKIIFLLCFNIFISLSFSENTINKASQNQEYSEVSEVEKEQILKQMSQILSKVNSFTVEFSQERHLSVFKDILSAKGILYYKSPDKLRWETTDPYRTILIFNHNKVAKFDFLDEKIRKLNLGIEDVMKEFLKNILSWMTGSFDNKNPMYDIKLFKGKSYKLILLPKDIEIKKYLISIELIIMPEVFQISEVIINEPGNDFIIIKYFNNEKDAVIDNNVFDTDKPALIEKNTISLTPTQ